MFLHVSNATKYCMFDVLLIFFHLSSSSFFCFDCAYQLASSHD